MSWAKGAEPWQKGPVPRELPHPISLARVPLVISHPLTSEKSICTTESFSTSHQKIYYSESSLGGSHCGKQEARLNVGWRNWKIWRRRDDIELGTTFRASTLGSCLQPCPLPVYSGLYSCCEADCPGETMLEGHRNSTNLGVCVGVGERWASTSMSSPLCTHCTQQFAC